MGCETRVKGWIRLAAALAGLSLLAGCGARNDEGPVLVSVIGGTPTPVDPNRIPPGPAQSALLGATAQGLVAFDATGQVEPGLAERWIVTDDGLSYIFRLRRLRWDNGKPVTATEVARHLRAAIAAGSRNPLKHALEAIDEIVVITPEVLEIRLSTPRPPLLQLLAQPELAILAGGKGLGPFRATAHKGYVTLDPLPEPVDADEDPAPIPPERSLVLRGERTALAVARFANRDIDLVLGGSAVDLAIARVANLPARQLRFDLADGLFGLAVVQQDGFLKDAANRRALAMAVDRQAIVNAFAVPGWQPAVAILPARFRSSADPALPDWAALPLDSRRQTASDTVSRWRARQPGGMPPLRLALPDAPGSAMLFAMIAADWRSIGIETTRVAFDADADIRLVDRVAPADSAIWYLAALACPAPGACDPAVTDAIRAVRASPTLAERGPRLAAADAAVTLSAAYIPIARPVRWSLVAPRLNQFRENPRAVHPLDRLRGKAN